MGSNGAATLTNLVNHQDLAPNYAGTLYGIANGIGNTAGFITPLVTAYFTQNGVRILLLLHNSCGFVENEIAVDDDAVDDDAVDDEVMPIYVRLKKAQR